VQRFAISSVRSIAPGSSGRLLECVWRAQIVLVVAADLAAGGRERHAVANARQHVLQRTPRTRVIAHLARGDERDVRLAGTRTHARLAHDVVGLAMAEQHRVQAIAERVAQIAHDIRGLFGIAPPRDHAGRPRADLGPRHDRRALVAAAPADREEPRQVCPATAIDRISSVAASSAMTCLASVVSPE
jgi:hypothetical protein